MTVGFFKKIAVADAIGLTVNSVYGNTAEATGLSALAATLLFAVQIYCDFSGYSDVAKGCAKLFGVELTENFKSPYGARSVKEFWNRWHISLSVWLRDYIYFPLGGSRVSAARWAFNTLVVFFISGLWHGASYNFIIWGLLHAAYQIVGKFTLPLRDRAWRAVGLEPEGRTVSFLRRFCTFMLVGFAWIFFRASTLTDANTVIVKIFSDYSIGTEYLVRTAESLSLSAPLLIYIILAVALLLFAERLKYPQTAETEKKRPLVPFLRFSSYVLMLWGVIAVWIVLQATEVGSSFIYFQF